MNNIVYFTAFFSTKALYLYHPGFFHLFRFFTFVPQIINTSIPDKILNRKILPGSILSILSVYRFIFFNTGIGSGFPSGSLVTYPLETIILAPCNNIPVKCGAAMEVPVKIAY